MATKSLQYKIGMDIGELRRNAEAAGSYTAGFRKELDSLEKKQRDHRKSIEDLGKGMSLFGVATVAGLGLAAKAAIDWETAWTGVRKTVDGSDREMAQLEGQLRGLARTLPSSHKEIAAVAEAAGQLGIKRQDIAAFTKTMIDLGQTTNLTAEEAASDLAKFSNIMGTSAKDVDRLGSTLVALGNDGASTEKDIISMGLRIAGAGKQLKLTESQVLGFASALSSVGIEAEAGGSAISTTMIKIASAVNSGGSELEGFASVAGMSGEKFTQAFRDDAGTAIIAFLQGLGRMQRTGQDVFGVLDGLGLSEIRVRDALLRAGSASDMFSKSLRVGSTAWAENTALTDEANKRYATSASKMQVAWNQIQDALIDVGATVVPVVSSLTTGVGDIVRAFQALPGPMRDIVTWAGAAVGGIALLGGGALVAGPKIMKFRDRMTDLIATGGAASKGLGKFGLFMAGPWGAALGAGALLLGVFASAVGGAARRQQELADAGKTVAQAIKEQNGVINTSVIQTAAKQAQEKGMLDTAKSLGIEMGVVTSAILGQGDAYKDLQGRLKAIVEQGTIQRPDQAGDLTAEAEAADELSHKLEALVGGKNDELNATKNVDQATREAIEGQKRFGNQMGLTDEQITRAAEDLGKLIQALDDTNGRTLNARSAQRDYMDAVQDAKNAVMAAAEARVQAAERVEAAERSVQSAQRSAKSAQDSLTRAQRDAHDAQVALTQARASEVERLEDLNRAVGDAALDEEAGMLALERAQERLVEVQRGGQSGLDLREAELGVRQAEHALVNTRDRYADIREEAEAANKAGVEGSDAVISAQRGVAESMQGVADAQQGVADAAREVRDALKEVARASSDPALQGFVRTLDSSTEAGRRNAEMLDRIASGANAMAQKAASDAERFGGAAAGAAALTASLKAARPALVATAIEFGMSQVEAEKYADKVLAIPPIASTLVTTPGSVASLAELRRVRDGVNGIPPGKTVNVGVLSETAIKDLERIGFKVQGLPDGTFTIYANTTAAYTELDRLYQTYQNRVLGIRVTPTGDTYYQGQGGRYYAAQGGIVSFASGGMHEDHRPQIARARKGTVRMWAEPETHRESYIPWAPDRRQAATGVLRSTADGFGYDLMPKGIPAASIGGGSAQGAAGGALHVTWEIIGGTTSEVGRLLAPLLQKYVRVTAGGSVQKAFGAG